jgi:hypothetical protein
MVSVSGAMYSLLHAHTFGLEDAALFGGIGAVSGAVCWLIAKMLNQRERTMK